MLINFLCSVLICAHFVCDAYGQLLRPDLMNLGTYNPKTKKYEKTDDFEYQPLVFRKVLLGGDDHDYKSHKKTILGGDDHDYKLHEKVLLGGDDHDYKSHKKTILGGDDHDYKLHEKVLLGGDDHDYKSHKKTILGGDDHDYKLHEKVLLGGDDHDYKSHKKTILGGDDHDYKLHEKVLLGGDEHDFKPHKKVLLGGDDHDFKPHKKALLGGDEHDYRPHEFMPGRDNHGYKQIHKKYFGGAPSHPHIEAFQNFMETYNRNYSSEKEFLRRFHIFQNNLKKIKVVQQNEMGTAKYGINEFADWTPMEFRKLLGLRPNLKPSVSQMIPAEIPDVESPVEFDWRKRGIVTEVKNQGMCGSCWAFSVTGNVEGQWALKHKKLYSLSEQELVDCDETDDGCGGGLPENAYKAIADLGGLETEKEYPYEGVDEKCHLDPEKVKVQVNGSVELPDDEEMMKRWLVKNGPISIGINAAALQFYVGGVSHPFKFLCSPDNLDHGMLIVGYGVHTYPLFKKSLPFWIVKNSWGESWGEQGYCRIYRGDGTCGINKMATSAIVP